MPVDPGEMPEGAVPQGEDVAVGPTSEVELEAGNGAVEGVVEGDGTPVKVNDVIPVSNALPDEPDGIPVELPAEKGGPVGEAGPGMEPPLVPVPVAGADAVPLVAGKGTEEDNVEISVNVPVPVGMEVPDSNSDVWDSPNELDLVPDTEPVAPGAVPEPSPGAVVLPAGKSVERDNSELDDGPASPTVGVVRSVPVTDTDVPLAKPTVVVHRVLVLRVELRLLVTL